MDKVDVDIQEIALDVERYAMQHGISPVALQNAKVETDVMKGAIEMLMIRVLMDVATHNLAENKVEYPANWWQHFKERFFPNWALEKWPVLYKTESITIKALFPNIPVNMDGRTNDYVLHAVKK